MYPVLIRLGNFQLRSYGVIIALSFFIGLWLSTTEAARKGLAGYGVARFAVEFSRGDPAAFGWGIPAAQVLGSGMILTGSRGFLLLRNNTLKFVR